MLKTYLNPIKASSAALLRHWQGFIFSFFLAVIGLLSISFLGNFGLVGGLIAGLIQVACIALYFQVLQESKNKRALKFKDLIKLDNLLFSATLNTAFIIYIGLLVANSVSATQGNNFVVLLYNLLLVLLLNPLPEIIYLRGTGGLEIFSSAFDFTKRHSLEWLLPLAIICLPVLIYNPSYAPVLLAKSSVLLPVSLVIVNFGIVNILMLLPVLLLAHWYMLFRMFLF